MKRLFGVVASVLFVLPDAQAQTCAAAITLTSCSDIGCSYVADTTQSTNWMTTFGPLISPSNDVLYQFTGGQGISGTITPTASNYLFALYLIPSCSDTGTEPPPIGATATIGRAIDLDASGVVGGHTYYLAVTGAAAGGSDANGTLSFVGLIMPVTLQTFEVD
ncbi:MAG TPA: hypothetical protein VFV97_03535 [Rhodanobacteraceae bacterium]|nr:hypothetical protein [Rhodanobacteraceae bacterium]